MLMTTLNLGR